MKRKNQVTITEAIRYFIREHGMEQRVLDSMVIDGWEAQMGEFMKKHTERIYVKHEVLYVQISNPAIKNELSYGKSKILKHINEFVGEEYLSDIKFL